MYEEQIRQFKSRLNEAMSIENSTAKKQMLEELKTEGRTDKYKKNIEILELGQIISDELIAIERAEKEIANGSYFGTLTKLYKAETRSLVELEVESFARSVMEIGDYKNTVDLARNERNIPTYSSGPSTLSGIGKFDIFGNDNGAAQLAHLLPQSTICAFLWFIIVSCVLNIGQVLFTDSTLTESEEGTSQASAGDNEQNKNFKFLQKCIHGFKPEKKNRTKKVGIKRIRLSNQADYLDRYPCVLIIPLLTRKGMIGWKGEGYDAIVLAGDWTSERIKADAVYVAIGATIKDKDEFQFANVGECNMACTLLEQMISFVCTEFVNSTFTSEFLSENLPKVTTEDTTESNQQSRFDTWKAAIEKIKKVGVPLPVTIENAWANNTMNVRKISFSELSTSNENTGSENMHVAPDPVLLLAKAASNWMKREGLHILPVCSDDESETSSDYVMSLNEEWAIRGWSNIVSPKEKPTEEISIVVNVDTFESFSDNEYLSE
jgi:hypothetical protein